MSLTKTSNPEIETQCFHCGNSCDGVLELDSHSFCCEGCRTVYSILSTNGMTDYYRLERFPGKTANEQDGERFSFLENVEIVNNLIDFTDGKRTSVTLKLPDIHCSSCIWLLENLNSIESAILDSRVNFTRKEAVISFDSQKISLREVSLLLLRIGYPPIFSAASGEKMDRKSGFSTLSVRLGIAGFCFGNVMLLSFPEYLGIQSLDGDYQYFFSWLNFAFSIPVLYSASIYFSSAVTAIKGRRVNIDVPIALGMLVLFFRSAFEVITESGPGFFDSFTGLVFFLLIGRWFQGKTYDAFSFDRDYRSYFPLAVTRLNGKEREIIPIDKIEKGDRLLIRNQEIFPADSLLLSPGAVINYSFVSGEQEPISVKKDELIYAGGRHIGQNIEVVVVKPVSQSYLTGLWDKDTTKVWERSADLILNKIGNYFTWVVLGIALITTVIWYFLDSSMIWTSVSAVLIIACPCALALTVPFVSGNVVRILGRTGIYLKGSGIVEKMYTINHLVFDKTGTITLSSESKVEFYGEPLDAKVLSLLSRATGNSLHPYSKAIHKYLGRQSSIDIYEFEEITGKGISFKYDQNLYKLGSAEWVGVKQTEAGHQVYFSLNGTIIGIFSILPTYRQDLKKVIAGLSQKYGISIVSGDNDKEERYLKKLFPLNTEFQFNQRPGDKLEKIERLQLEGKRVMMLGDGLNDAPAMLASTVGVSVVDDMSLFSPASDIIMDGKAFGKLERAVSFVKSSKWILIGTIVISFLYNVVGISLAVLGLLTPLVAAIFMPLSSISVVIFSTVGVYYLARAKSILS